MSKIYDLLGAIISKVTNAVNAIPKKLSELENDAGFITKQKQSDWNQNDPTEADYVKNRPFWTAKEFILERQDFEFVENSEMGGLNGVILPDTLSIPEGDVTVFWDGVEYNCVNADYFFGNAALLGGEGTGEPFAFLFSGGWGVVALNSGNHEVGIACEVPHKLDAGFLPDGVVRRLIVTLSENDRGNSADRTYDEIKDSIHKGLDVVLTDGYQLYSLEHINEQNREISFYSYLFNTFGRKLQVDLVMVKGDNSIEKISYKSGEFVQV